MYQAHEIRIKSRRTGHTVEFRFECKCEKRSRWATARVRAEAAGDKHLAEVEEN